MKRIIKFITVPLLFFILSGQLIGQVNILARGEKKPWAVDDEGMTTELHKKYINQIVFSDKSIDRSDPESAYIDSYTLGDPLHFRIYLRKSMTNCMLEDLQNHENSKAYKRTGPPSKVMTAQTDLRFTAYIDGQEIVKRNDASLSAEDKMNLTSMRYEMRNPEKDNNYFGNQFYKALVIEMEKKGISAGSHRLKVEVTAYTTSASDPRAWNNVDYNVLASGEIDLIVTDDNTTTESDCFPQAQMVDDELSSSMIEAFKQKNFKEIPLKAVILSRDWVTKRNEFTGIILGRQIDAVVISRRDKELIYQSFSFEQDYNGADFGVTYLSGIGYQKQVSAKCEQYLK